IPVTTTTTTSAPTSTTTTGTTSTTTTSTVPPGVTTTSTTSSSSTSTSSTTTSIMVNPMITVAPPAVEPNTSFRLSGTGFTPGRAVSLIITAERQPSPGTFSGTASSTGTIDNSTFSSNPTPFIFVFDTYSWQATDRVSSRTSNTVSTIVSQPVVGQID